MHNVSIIILYKVSIYHIPIHVIIIQNTYFGCSSFQSNFVRHNCDSLLKMSTSELR